MNLLPLEILPQIFCTSIETLIISQFLNTNIRKLMIDKFTKLDRNLLLTKFLRSGQNFKANKDLIVIHIQKDYINDIKYEKCLSDDCFLITSNEYLKIIDKCYDQMTSYRVSYVYGREIDDQMTSYRVSCVYGREIANQFYINPYKMIVKKFGGRHENFTLTKDKSLKDICDSKEYIEVNFTVVFDLKDTEYY